MSEKQPLSAGLPTSSKVLAFVFVVLLVIVLLFVGLVASALSRSSGSLAVAGPIVMAVVGVVGAVGVVWGLAAAIRTGAYVEGTELVVQHAFRTKRVDLATAQQLVLTDARAGIGTMPVLGVHGDSQGRSVTVIFRGVSTGLLPHAEVAALTAAIRAGSRTGQSAHLAETVIATLGSRAAT